MFKKVITSTLLTTDAANQFFGNITGRVYQGDCTFVATLRALVAPRMKEDERLKLRFYQKQCSSTTIERHGIAVTVNDVLDAECCENGEIVIFSFEGTDDSTHAYIELMQNSFETIFHGWHRLEKVTSFYQKSFDVLCFVNPDKKSVVLFVDHMDIRRMHYLQCSIFAFLPWYFDPQQGVSELEMDLIKSLREKSSDVYENCIAKIAEQYDFRTAQIRQLLDGFETRFERVECADIRNEIQSVVENLNELNSRIGSYLRRKSDLEVRLLGLESKIESSTGDSEIMAYFLCNNKLSLVDVDGTVVRFVVKDYLEYYDEDMAKQMIDNNTSYIYRPNDRACNSYIPANDVKKLMYAIFIEQRLKIKFCAAYEFQIDGSVRGMSRFDYGIEFSEYMPNPHINIYSCLGNHSRAINELLMNRNYIGAIEQCVASCKSLNFADSVVMREFMRGIYGISDYAYTNCCIELPDGVVVTPKDAITWLKAQEQEAQASE